MNANAAVAAPAETPALDLRVEAARLHVLADAIRRRARADLRLGETLTKAQDRREARAHHRDLMDVADETDTLARKVRAYCERAGV